MNKKRILIYVETVSSTIRGGTEKASYVLHDNLNKLGYDTSLLCLRCDECEYENNHIYRFCSSESLFGCGNKEYLERICHNDSIDIVINMSGNSEASYFFNSKYLSVRAKIITVINFSIFEGINHFRELVRFEYNTPKAAAVSFLKWLLIPLRKHLAVARKRKKLQSMLRESWKVVVLSESYIRDLQLLSKIDSNNIMAIPVIHQKINPNDFSKYKQNVVLYVGRLDFCAKRVDRLLKIWSMVENNNSEWELHIVGDGKEKNRLLNLVQTLRLKNVFFQGMQVPYEFYNRAKIFCLTSTHEGMPLAVIEAMERGCYPIMFDSFSAAREMIPSTKYGKLVTPFNLKAYAYSLSSLMGEDYKSPETDILDRYAPEQVMQKWIDCIEEDV